ncbi:BCD family MFS transporter [Ideonella sp. DXS29W]|uniref:BCD family MFS transporter n=1 Tax=Ideonella lacteola TaxID=2984193 RepID=A0ABU9BMW1_9BURK
MNAPFGWLQIARLGLVQAALGAIVVLTTSTLNRIMVVELALPALLPGMLVAWHYAVQIARPRLGHGSDIGSRRTPWIIGGMVVLALGGALAALATAWMGSSRWGGIGLAVVAFSLIGLGVAACGTSLLVLLAKRVAPERRAGAATLVWLMMIVGFAVTAGTSGPFLDPYSPRRLVLVATSVCAIALLVTLLSMAGLEGRSEKETDTAQRSDPAPPQREFGSALREVWADPAARGFTVFVFVSMLAFSAQDLILEPFAGSVFGYTPGQSTSLSGVQHGGVLAGMLLAAFAGRRVRGRSTGTLRAWTISGCIASALALAGLCIAGIVGGDWPFKLNVWVLGAANGAFSIAAIGSMMRLAGEGPHGSEGVRMGLWGAAQAIAFALGGLLGTGLSDLARALIGTPGTAYAAVFAIEALLFAVSARLAARVGADAPTHAALPMAWSASRG